MFLRSIFRAGAASAKNPVASSDKDDSVRLLFDEAWYRAGNDDLSSEGDLFAHYESRGWREGRWPNPVFDPVWYLKQYPDVAARDTDPLAHFARYGRFEGRRPSAAFDPDVYLRLNPDVAEAGREPCEHYVRYGRLEGREMHAPRRVTPDFLAGVVLRAGNRWTRAETESIDRLVADAALELDILDQDRPKWQDRLLAKQVHRVEEGLRPAPDGLSLAYLELADGLNSRVTGYETRIANVHGDLIDAVEALIQREVADALKLEAQLASGSVA